MTDLRRVARQVAKEAFCASLEGLSFVDRSLRYDSDFEWLIILTMPNSGSTALARLLMTANSTIALTEQCEGEWLIPSMSNLRHRWDEDLRLSMSRVRARWMWRLRAMKTGSPKLVIEKSPPNMVRIDRIRAALAPMAAHTVVLVRDPYAVCESWHRRYGREQLSRTSLTALQHVDSERDYFRLLGECWVQRGTYLVEQLPKALSVVRYEELVMDPGAVTAELAKKIPMLSDVQSNAEVRVKDYAAQALTDMNSQQIDALTTEQIDAITCGLERGIDTVKALGYTLRHERSARP
ncbi:MAG: sulfotransferase [Pseudomonadota bacterium]